MSKCILALIMVLWLSSAASANASDITPDDRSKRAKEYLTRVAKILRDNYFPPHGTEMSLIAISFIIGCDGTTGSIILEKAALLKGHRMWLADKSAMRAIKNASPIPKPIDVFQCPTQLEVVYDGKDLTKPFTCIVQTKDHKYVSDVVGYTGK